MWEWLKRQFNNIKIFFVNLWQDPAIVPPTSVGEDIKLPDIPTSTTSTMLINKLDPVHSLKQNALKNIGDAEELLRRTDLKDHLNYDEYCELIYAHRQKLTRQFIQESMAKNNISFVTLANYSPKNALVLLKSRYFDAFETDELAQIYYTHRHDKDFIVALTQKRESSTQYPNVNFIPSISYILKTAASSKQTLERRTIAIIRSSSTLLYILTRELASGHQYKRQTYAPRNVAIQLPKKNPYELLGLQRNANDKELKGAYHRKALEVHPDKIETINANRFKEVNEAYEFLMDPEKRKAWNDAYPESTKAESSEISNNRGGP